MPLSDEKLKAHEMAADLMKQIITLSTALIGATATFAKDLLTGSVQAAAYRWLIGLGWILYIVAILGAIGCLMCIAGNLEKRPDPKIYTPNALLFSGVAIIFFVGGTVALALYAWMTLI